MNTLTRLIKILVCSSSFLWATNIVNAQSTSVMIDELTTTEVQTALDAGMTTAIYYVGGTHQSGPAVGMG